jgi:hypothetical protein
MHSMTEIQTPQTQSTNPSLIQIDLEAGVAIAQPVQEAPKNKFSLFYTAFSTSIGVAVNYSVGATIRHHPLHNGAITALTDGVIVGAIIGYIGGSLDIKEKNNNTLTLALCGVLLDWAAAVVVVEEVPVITTLEATASDENLPSATMV